MLSGCVPSGKALSLSGPKAVSSSGDCNFYLEGLEDQNNLREQGRGLKGTKCFASGGGVFGK